MSEELKPCRNCGGKCDPTGWMCGDGRQGPECEGCGITTPDVQSWNRLMSAELSAIKGGGGAEPVEVVCITQGGCDVTWTATKELSPAGTAFMTVAQHQRIVAALSAQQTDAGDQGWFCAGCGSNVQTRADDVSEVARPEQTEQQPVAAALDDAVVAVASAAYEREALAGATHEQAWHAALSEALTAPTASGAVPVPRELLERVLDQMECDFYQIDSEWGPTEGGLDGAIARGEAEEIRELRALLAKGVS